MGLAFTLNCPRIIVVAQKATWVTARTKMKICNLCRASRDISGTFPCRIRRKESRQRIEARSFSLGLKRKAGIFFKGHLLGAVVGPAAPGKEPSSTPEDAREEVNLIVRSGRVVEVFLLTRKHVTGQRPRNAYLLNRILEHRQQQRDKTKEHQL